MNSYFPIENSASVAEGHFFRMREKVRSAARASSPRERADMTTHSECLLLISSN